LRFFSLEQAIDANKEVRLIDVFVKPHYFIKLVILWFFDELTLSSSLSNRNDRGNFVVRKKKNEIASPQNSTFASPDTRADASACKRAVLLPTHWW
jgi:hypothetical protein